MVKKDRSFFYFVDFGVDIDKIVDNAVDIEESRWILRRASKSGYGVDIA